MLQFTPSLIYCKKPSYKIQVLNTLFNKTKCYLKTLRLVLCWLGSLLPIIRNWWQLKLSLKNRATWNWTEHIFPFVVWHILYLEGLGYVFLTQFLSWTTHFSTRSKTVRPSNEFLTHQKLWLGDAGTLTVQSFFPHFFFSLPNSLPQSFRTSLYWQLSIVVRSTGANVYIVSIILWKHIDCKLLLYISGDLIT